MTFGIRIIRADIIPDEEVELNEFYYVSVAAIDPENPRRTMTLKGTEGRIYMFYYNIVNVDDEFDFESQFMLNCCV